MKLRRNPSRARRWLAGAACAAMLGPLLGGCAHERVEVRTLPSPAPPTRTSELNTGSVRLRVVATPAQRYTRQPTEPGPVQAPATAAFPVDAPEDWGLALRVERVQSCRVTETRVMQRQLVTHYSPTWVVYAAGFTALGIGVQAELNDAEPDFSYSMLIGGGLILASTFLFRSEEVEPMAPGRTQHLTLKPCGTSLDGSHRLTFGPNRAVRRVFIPRSGERFLPGVTLDDFKFVFLDGDPVEVLRGAGPSTPDP